MTHPNQKGIPVRRFGRYVYTRDNAQLGQVTAEEARAHHVQQTQRAQRMGQPEGIKLIEEVWDD